MSFVIKKKMTKMANTFGPGFHGLDIYIELRFYYYKMMFVYMQKTVQSASLLASTAPGTFVGIRY